MPVLLATGELARPIAVASVRESPWDLATSPPVDLAVDDRKEEEEEPPCNEAATSALAHFDVEAPLVLAEPLEECESSSVPSKEETEKLAPSQA